MHECLPSRSSSQTPLAEQLDGHTMSGHTDAILGHTIHKPLTITCTCEYFAIMMYMDALLLFITKSLKTNRIPSTVKKHLLDSPNTSNPTRCLPRSRSFSFFGNCGLEYLSDAIDFLFCFFLLFRDEFFIESVTIVLVMSEHTVVPWGIRNYFSA